MGLSFTVILLDWLGCKKTGMPSEASGRCLIVILLHELRKLPSGSLSSGSVGSDEFQCICFEPFARSVLTTILSRLKKGLLIIILAL